MNIMTWLIICVLAFVLGNITVMCIKCMEADEDGGKVTIGFSKLELIFYCVGPFVFGPFYAVLMWMLAHGWIDFPFAHKDDKIWTISIG